MPRVNRRPKRRSGYSPQERRVLLTGTPLNPQSTRFGHPRLPSGWNVPAVREAWSLLRDELLAEWESPMYAAWRERSPRPWAERLLSQEDAQCRE